jgi:hypothetical protein
MLLVRLLVTIVRQWIAITKEHESHYFPGIIMTYNLEDLMMRAELHRCPLRSLGPEFPFQGIHVGACFSGGGNSEYYHLRLK